jgi:hypothetical protein
MFQESVLLLLPLPPGGRIPNPEGVAPLSRPNIRLSDIETFPPKPSIGLRLLQILPLKPINNESNHGDLKLDGLEIEKTYIDTDKRT